VRGLAPATVAGLLALAAPAHAATFVGTTNVNAAPASAVTCAPGCSVVLDGATAPAGVIVRWRFQGEGALSLVVYRPSSRTQSQLVAARPAVSDLLTGAGAGMVVQAPARIPVAAGDMIGVLVPEGAKLFSPAPGGGLLWTGQEQGGTLTAGPPQPGDALYQADVEADADGDGFGDETQDLCPSQPATQGTCVPPLPPFVVATLRSTSVRVSKRGTIALTVRNPNVTAVTGTVTVKQGRRTVAAASYALAAGASKKLTLKLAALTRRALRSADRLRLPLAIVTRTATTSRSATTTLTLRRA
jgi:hypothetical protein